MSHSSCLWQKQSCESIADASCWCTECCFAAQAEAGAARARAAEAASACGRLQEVEGRPDSTPAPHLHIKHSATKSVLFRWSFSASRAVPGKEVRGKGVSGVVLCSVGG